MVNSELVETHNSKARLMDFLSVDSVSIFSPVIVLLVFTNHEGD